MPQAMKSTISVENVLGSLAFLNPAHMPYRAKERLVIADLKSFGYDEEAIKDAIGDGIDRRIIYRQGELLVAVISQEHLA